MLAFLKKLLGLDNKDVWAPSPELVTEAEKVQVVEKKAPKSSLPKKTVAKKTTTKREKPSLKVVKTEPKKRGRPAKSK
jgi:hypothetical protein